MTFAPTPSASSIRILGALACRLDRDICHFDIEQTFVYSDLDSEMYLRFLSGCSSMSGKVVRLIKSLYGLKQASRQWHQLLMTTLKDIGSEQCFADPCVMSMMVGNALAAAIIVRDDDLLFAGTRNVGDVIVNTMSKVPPTKRLRELAWHTGSEFRWNRVEDTVERSRA